MFFKKKTKLQKIWEAQANESGQFLRPSLSFLVSDIAEHITKSVKAEGATDEDIIWWHNLSDSERNTIIQFNNQQILAAHYHFHKTLGLSMKDLMKKVYQAMIVYGVFPLQSDHMQAMSDLGFSANDYQLPWELSARTGKYVMELATKGILEEEVKGFSTRNAFLRHKIKIGDIKLMDYTK